MVPTMPTAEEVIQAVVAELAAIMLPAGAVVLDPDELAHSLADWHERRDRLAQDDDWCESWPDQLSLRDAILDLLLVYEDEIVFRLHLDHAEAAGDHQDVETWRGAIAQCVELGRALAERIATLIGTSC
jgi:hypothetical protein